METLESLPVEQVAIETEAPKKSKKAIRREKKKEKWAELKEKIKKDQKLKKKQKKLLARQAKAEEESKEGNKDGDKKSEEGETSKNYIPRKKYIREDYKKLVDEGLPVIIDCGFQDLLTEKEIISLVTQLAYCHHVNKQFDKPTKLTITGYKDKVKERLGKYEAQNWGIQLVEGHYLDIYPKEQLVYLSGDATEEIHELDPTYIYHSCFDFSRKVYIVGGLVDHNRYKKGTYNKAIQEGIACKRLPIGDHLKLKTSSILAVNHVFEIMARLYNGETMEQALKNAIPKRKVEEPKILEEIGEKKEQPTTNETN